MTSLLPFLTTNYLSAIYDPESRHHSLRKMNSNFTTPFTAIDQIFKSNSYLWHNLSAFSLLQVHSYFNKMTRGPSVFQLRQIMPCCYEVPPTLWRPNSFFRVRWAPLWARTCTHPPYTCYCFSMWGMSKVKWSVYLSLLSLGSVCCPCPTSVWSKCQQVMGRNNFFAGCGELQLGPHF